MKRTASGASVGVVFANLLVADIFVAELRRAGLIAQTLQIGQLAPQKIESLTTNVVLLDVVVIERVGALLHDILRAGMKVLVLGEIKSAVVISSLMAGASGAVNIEEVTPAVLANAVTQVARGEASLHPVVAAAILDQWRDSQSRKAPTSRAPLTDRELEVLQVMGTGASAREVARSLALSMKTVEAHKSRIYDKLGVRGHIAAVRYAVNQGLIAGGPEN